MDNNESIISKGILYSIKDLKIVCNANNQELLTRLESLQDIYDNPENYNFEDFVDNINKLDSETDYKLFNNQDRDIFNNKNFTHPQKATLFLKKYPLINIPIDNPLNFFKSSDPNFVNYFIIHDDYINTYQKDNIKTLDKKYSGFNYSDQEKTLAIINDIIMDEKSKAVSVLNIFNDLLNTSISYQTLILNKLRPYLGYNGEHKIITSIDINSLKNDENPHTIIHELMHHLEGIYTSIIYPGLDRIISKFYYYNSQPQELASDPYLKSIENYGSISQPQNFRLKTIDDFLNKKILIIEDKLKNLDKKIKDYKENDESSLMPNKIKLKIETLNKEKDNFHKAKSYIQDNKLEALTGFVEATLLPKNPKDVNACMIAANIHKNISNYINKKDTSDTKSFFQICSEVRDLYQSIPSGWDGRGFVNPTEQYYATPWEMQARVTSTLIEGFNPLDPTIPIGPELDLYQNKLKTSVSVLWNTIQNSTKNTLTNQQNPLEPIKSLSKATAILKELRSSSNNNKNSLSM